MKLKTKQTNSSIQLNLQIADLERSFVQPYKQKIKELEKILDKRDKYIIKLHDIARGKRIIFYTAAASHHTIKSLPKRLSVNRMTILCFLYEKDMVRKSDLLRISANLILGQGKYITDIKNLLDLQLIKCENNLYYISDKGKEFVEYYEGNIRKNVKELLKESLRTTNRFPTEGKYSEEEKEIRRERYRKIMRPFWDKNIKMIPKDVGKRVQILKEYIDKHPKDKEYYTNLMLKWSSKN